MPNPLQPFPPFPTNESNSPMISLLHSIRSEEYTVRLRASRREHVRSMLEQGIANRSFMVDFDAEQMAFLGAAAISEALSFEDQQKLALFGRGLGLPLIAWEGLPSQSIIPNTPQGFGDDTQVVFADSMLLGAMRIAGLFPISFSYENFGRLMRNVAPNKIAENAISSHGAKLPLEWHSDNSYAFENGYRSPRSTGAHGQPLGSPSPRFLCFVSMRNHDAGGNMVPTELLLAEELLSAIPERVQSILRRPIFEIRPGASNDRLSLKNMPLLETCSWTGENLLKFNANEGQTVGLTPIARRAVSEVSQRLLDLEDKTIPIYLAPGQILFFDNYRVLHRRGSFDPGPLLQARWLRRCFGTTDPSAGAFVDREHRPYVWM
jgi:L-asparagine oxygenase